MRTVPRPCKLNNNNSNSRSNESWHFALESHFRPVQLFNFGAHRAWHDVPVSSIAIDHALVGTQDIDLGGARLFAAPLFCRFRFVFGFNCRCLVRALNLSAVQEQIFVGLCGAGILLQLLFGQRLSVGDELTVERFVTGEFLRLKKSDIAAVELYRPALNPRQKRVQLRLGSGESAQLDFGQDIVSDLREWVGLTAI